MARILIAEDDPAVREFVERALGGRGHEVTAVEDGLAALEALAVDAFDLLLTDIRMPGLDGVTLALNMESEAAVDEVLDFAVSCGAKLTKPAEKVFWGGYSADECDF